MSDFPTSRLERGTIMAKTGLKVGASYAGYHLKKVLGKEDGSGRSAMHTKNATTVFKELSKLRGTALKLAQALSLDNGILPEEFVDVMSQAQYQVPPINRSLVRMLIRKELGDYPEKIFASFEPEAMAAASIGQVHRARLKDGRDVAIKIQYPNVRETIGSDLSVAKSLFKRIVSHPSTDDYFEEVRAKLLEETDYINEGRQMERYAKLFNSEKYQTPLWIPEFSTERVLAMTYVPGRHLDAFLRENPSKDKRDHYGQLMWDFFHDQLDNNYTVYADAHPGNFLFTPDGKLGILDFGCIKTSPADFFNNYIRLFDVHMNDDMHAMREVYQNLEMIDREPKDPVFEEKFYLFCRSFGDHFLSPYKSDLFDFGDKAFEQTIAKFAREAVQFTEPRGSKHFIYVSRLHIGLYQMLMKIGSRIQTTQAREKLERYNEELGSVSLV
jgi:predicted unusual protein kinase regulating ubiquinone biosynthesis (AarF/ABC1/UbiB family)